MTKKKISAKEIASDIKAGMKKSDLLKKYNIPSLEKFESLIDKLVSHKLLNDADKAKLFQKFACPACGVCNSGTFSECPSCGIIVSKYKEKEIIKENPLLEKCNACGGQVSKNATACPHCGEPINNAQEQSKIYTKEKPKDVIKEKKSKTIRLISSILGWFFGSFFLLNAITFLSVGRIIAGVICIPLAAIVLPPILPKLKISLSWKTKTIAIIILLVAVNIALFDNSKKDSNSISDLGFDPQYRPKSELVDPSRKNIKPVKSYGTKKSKKVFTSSSLPNDVKADVRRFIVENSSRNGVVSGFISQDYNSHIQIMFELNVIRLGANPEMAAKQISDRLASIAASRFNRDVTIHTYYGNHNSLSMSTKLY